MAFVYDDDMDNKQQEDDESLDIIISKCPLRRPRENLIAAIPPEYKSVYDYYLKHFASFWSPEELLLKTDTEQCKTVDRNIMRFIIVVIAFFSTADTVVTDNLAQRFLKDVTLPEAQYFYTFQMAMENVHSITYKMLIDTYVPDNNILKELVALTADSENSAIGLKRLWATKWLENYDADFGERLVAFAAVEGIFFSASFCGIFWVKKKGILPGLCQSNELISRDENLHMDFACLLLSIMYKPPSVERRRQIIKDAVIAEEKFVREALFAFENKDLDSGDDSMDRMFALVEEALDLLQNKDSSTNNNELVGMNSALMIQYIRFQADNLAYQLGCGQIYGVDNPFDWMELQGLAGKTNFFEHRTSEYAHSSFSVGKDGTVKQNQHVWGNPDTVQF